MNTAKKNCGTGLVCGFKIENVQKMTHGTMIPSAQDI